MTTKELIRAEIERLKRHAEESKMEWVSEGYNQNAFAEDCRIRSFDKLLTFIDTLPDEPVSNDLKEAAEEYRQGKVDFGCDYDSDGNSLYHSACLADAFIVGAEWQSKKAQETIKTAEDHAFLAGADWQKEQMREKCSLKG